MDGGVGNRRHGGQWLHHARRMHAWYAARDSVSLRLDTLGRRHLGSLLRQARKFVDGTQEVLGLITMPRRTFQRCRGVPIRNGRAPVDKLPNYALVSFLGNLYTLSLSTRPSIRSD